MDTVMNLVARSDFDAPPPERTRLQNHPTLLISWWCTAFSLFLILLRLWGRWVRTDQFFREDKIMALGIAPLLIRMALVDPIMLYGTNSTVTVGLTPEDIYYRSIGSRLVLGSRIFYALYIWVAKYAVSEYLTRLTNSIWTKKYDYVLIFIRIFLALTFLAVFIATLAECQPFSHYWQVVPDPGPSCRDGFAQLFTMGTCDGITDILLIAFPIPIVWSARMPFLRKISLCILFSLSAILIGITAYRVPAIYHSQNNQQLRTLWASIEILAATTVANALILGSFIRDRGVKKAKFNRHQHQASRNESVNDQPAINRVMTKKHWGMDSDEDLFSALRGRMGHHDHYAVSKPPRVVPARCGNVYREMSTSDESSSEDDKKMTSRPYSDSSGTDGELNLFDIGGVLEGGPPSSPDSAKGLVKNAAPPSKSKHHHSPSNPVDLGGLLSSPVLSPAPRSRKDGEPKVPATIAVTDVDASSNIAKAPDQVRTTVINVSEADQPPAYGSTRAARAQVQGHKAQKAQDGLELGDEGGLLSTPPKPLQKQGHQEHVQYPAGVSQDLVDLLSEGPEAVSHPEKSESKPKTSTPFDFQDIGNLLNSPMPEEGRHDFASRMKPTIADRRKKTRPQSEADELKCARDILGKIKDVRNQPAEPLSPARRLHLRPEGRTPPPGASGLRQHPTTPRFGATPTVEMVETPSSPSKFLSPRPHP